MLKFSVFIFIYFVLNSAIIHVDAESEPKVKIGIKKRVDNCSMKTRKGDFVHVHYKGTLLANGSEFDNSFPRGVPFTFTLGSGQVIKGWEQGLLGMCKGEKRRIVVPPELGYGKTQSITKIPADSTLVFDVALIEIERKTEL